MSKEVKIKIYITIVKPAEVNGSETWPMTEMDINPSAWSDEHCLS
jgi:hypothetical protein